jgi:small subunit ribosomal protein S12
VVKASVFDIDMQRFESFYPRMSTKTQLLLKKNRKKKNKKIKKLLLEKCPQKKGTCLKVFTMSPKKPNSASRKVVKIVLLSTKKRTQCHIPGIKHSLQRYSTVLIRGGRVKDLPGVKYRVIRGKFDLKSVYDRFKARSKYGIQKIEKK